MKKGSWLQAKREQWKKTMLNPIDPNIQEQKFEPLDKPVQEYERTLFLYMLLTSIMAKIIFFVTKWRGIHLIAFVFVILVIALSLFRLLVPPRLSKLRLTYLGCSLIMGWILLHPDFL